MPALHFHLRLQVLSLSLLTLVPSVLSTPRFIPSNPIPKTYPLPKTNGSNATNAYVTLVPHEKRLDAIPDGFVDSGAAADDDVLDLRLMLVQGNMTALEERLYAVSTPGGAEYGKHLSKDEVEQFVRPSNVTMELVDLWLNANGLTSKNTSATGDVRAVSMRVSQANRLLDTNFTVFTHPATGKKYTRVLSYSIPAALVGHLDLIHPTISFENAYSDVPVSSKPVTLPKSSVKFPKFSIKPKPSLTSRGIPSIPCDQFISPSCLQSLYSIPTKAATQPNNTLSVTGITSSFPNRADLAIFLSTFRTDMRNTTTYALETLDGGKDPQDPKDSGDEADLDIQYTIGIATDVPTTFVSVGERNKDGALSGLLDIANFLLAKEKTPTVWTSSYSLDEVFLSPRLARHACNAYMQLGARGTSVFFSSGDGGVAGQRDTGASCKAFRPTFPSTCPFVTSVGATQGLAPEVAWNLSTGGFSNIFTQPAYQLAAVADYLAAYGNNTNNSSSANAGRFNATGRGFPDVSAQGVDYLVVEDRAGDALSGTSASTPVVASVVSLLNDALMAAGKPPLGFLNPFLYSANGTAALNVISSGSNVGCNSTGFFAREGWSPVTGLGTPNYKKLRAAVGL